MVRRVVGIVYVVAATLLAACDSEEEREAKECEDSVYAYIMSQTFVERQLVAPSTAEFPYASKISNRHLGNCRHRVVAYVDAQNSFGAMLRKPYTAVVRYDGNGTWLLESLDLE